MVGHPVSRVTFALISQMALSVKGLMRYARVVCALEANVRAPNSAPMKFVHQMMNV